MSNENNKTYDTNGYFLIPIEEKDLNIEAFNEIKIKSWIKTNFESLNENSDENESDDYFLKNPFLNKMFNLNNEEKKSFSLIKFIYELKEKTNFKNEQINNNKEYKSFILKLNLDFLKVDKSKIDNSEIYLALFMEQNRLLNIEEIRGSNNEKSTNKDLKKKIAEIKKSYVVKAKSSFSSFQIEYQNLNSKNESLLELWNKNSSKIFAELSTMEDVKILFWFTKNGINKDNFEKFNSTYKLIHLFFYIFEFFGQQKALYFFSEIENETNEIKNSITLLEKSYINLFLDENNDESINTKILDIKTKIDNLEKYILDFRNWLFNFSENIFSKHNQINNFFKEKYRIHNIEKTISNWENQLNRYKEIFVNFNKRIEKIENNLLSITKKIDNYYEIKNKGKNLFFNIIIYIVSAFLGVCSLFQVIQGFSLEKELTFKLILN
ncbi:hypothetical protein [Mycoplasmopsis iners]|uniref:hypothetical protein n=1 Tax=Mycoplasmopsis iners TaxID=76630 RepID=UPI0004952A9B|nr:hypothetical protein [Mycoplasmopsis iners]